MRVISNLRGVGGHQRKSLCFGGFEAGEVRGSFSQEGQVLVLFCDLAVQPQQLGPLRRRQWFIGRSSHRVQPTALISYPPGQR